MFILRKFYGDRYKRINAIIDSLDNRLNSNIDLIGSSSIPFPEVCEISRLPITACRVEGYLETRYFPGTKSIDIAESLAQQKIIDLFSLPNDYEVNVQPHSATQSNHAVWKTCLAKGDRVLGLSLKDGGHISHSLSLPDEVNFFPFPINNSGIDYDALKVLSRKVAPKLIIAGGTSYPLDIDFKYLRGVANESNAYLHADLAHIAPFVASGIHSQAIPYADTITLDTSKSLRGLKGGILIYKKGLSRPIRRSLFPILQSSPNMTSIIGKACLFTVWDTNKLREFSTTLIETSILLGKELIKNGLKLVFGGTKTHILLVDLTEIGITGLEAEQRLEEHQILVNRNSIPGERLKPWIGSGIRIGTTAISILKYETNDIIILAKLIARIIKQDNWDRLELAYLIKKYHSEISSISNEPMI